MKVSYHRKMLHLWASSLFLQASSLLSETSLCESSTREKTCHKCYGIYSIWSLIQDWWLTLLLLTGIAACKRTHPYFNASQSLILLFWLLWRISEPIHISMRFYWIMILSKWTYPYSWYCYFWLLQKVSESIHPGPSLNGFLLDWWIIVLFSSIAGCKWHSTIYPLGFSNPHMHTVPKGLRLWPADLNREESVDFMDGVDE